MTDLSPPPGANESVWMTAVHEAGHVVFAISVGLRVVAVDVVPTADRLGRTETRALHMPTEAECQPGSPWIELAVKHALAGDRAVRVYAPHWETATGGPTSDYYRANAYLQAVYPSNAVEGHLDRCCRELDAFFEVSAVRKDVANVATALLERRSLSGDEVRELLVGGRCGAFNEDLTQRCQSQPHDPRAEHYSVVTTDSGVKPVEWSYLDWSRDKTPLTKRSALSKRVLRVYHPGLFPAPRHDLITDDLPGLRAVIADAGLPENTRARARKMLARLLAAREREEIQHSLTPPALPGQPRDLLQRHSDECGDHLTPDADGDYWCGECGFEILNPDSARHPKRIYQIVERHLAVPPGDSTEPPRPVLVATDLIFSTAKEAQTLLRLAKDDLPDTGVIRLPLPARPPKPRSAST